MQVVCPLAFESSALARTARERGWSVACSGPGAGSIRRWGQFAVLPPGSLVVLAGVAGGLADGFRAGAARVATVRDTNGHMWSASIPTSWTGRRATCLSVDAPLADPAAKRAAGIAHAADIVDMESAAFADVATTRGWRWAIIRGISDAVDDRLPAGIDRWTDQWGETQLGTVAGDLATRPWMLPAVIALGRRSRAAMHAVRDALLQLDANERGLGRSGQMPRLP
jgi:adenosylhomocysteine nucleosidase